MDAARSRIGQAVPELTRTGGCMINHARYSPARISLLLLVLLLLVACVGCTLPGTSAPAPRGASVPWIEYEAEAGSTNGALLAASRTFGTIPAESSGRRSVKLSATGQYVQFNTTQAANSLVLRFVIP